MLLTQKKPCLGTLQLNAQRPGRQLKIYYASIQKQTRLDTLDCSHNSPLGYKTVLSRRSLGHKTDREPLSQAIPAVLARLPRLKLILFRTLTWLNFMIFVNKAGQLHSKTWHWPINSMWLSSSGHLAISGACRIFRLQHQIFCQFTRMRTTT